MINVEDGRRSHRCSSKARLPVVALLVALLGTSTASIAGDPAKPIQFDIPVQPLAASLRALANQADIQIVFSPEAVAGRNGPAVSGTMSAREALDRLLEAASLEFVVEGEDTIVVRPRRNTAPAAASVSSASAAVPEAAAPVKSALEEIVVTAQKREENLQDTPISIVAISAADLENRGINDINDLSSEVPALQVVPHPNSSATARVFIRGIGNIDDQITQDPSVAVYLDGVYVARSQGLSAEVAEVERIEVLRGPQGSLYGRNATGGAINYITRAPELGALGLKQTLSLGNFDQFRSRTRLNVPVGETLAFDLGYLHSEKNGFTDNLGTGAAHFSDQRRDAYRAGLRWQPEDAIDVRYGYDRSEMRDSPSFLAQVPLYPLEADRPRAGSPSVRDLHRNDVMTEGHHLAMSWDISGGLTLKSISGYRELGSRTAQQYLTGVLGPFSLITNAFDEKQKQLTQEFQAIGTVMDSRLDYVFGAYYFDESADSFVVTTIVGLPRTDRTLTIDNSAYALYGMATYRSGFIDGLYISPSVRWSRDERKATFQQTAIPAAGPPAVGLTTPADRSFSNVSPGLVIGLNGWDDINVYAKYARGYKSGGYNIRASSPTRFAEGFDEETLDSFELGMKSSWLDDRVRLNVAASLSKYKDIQVAAQTSSVNPGITDVLNVGKATIKSIELDLTARPIRELTVGLGYAYLDARYDEIVDPITGNDIANFFVFLEAPEHTLSTSVQYEFPVTPIGRLTSYADYYYRDDKHTGSANDKRFISRAHGLLDARLTLSEIPFGFGNWRISAYGKNLMDKEYYVQHFNAFLPIAVFGEPRTYGVEIAFEY